MHVQRIFTVDTVLLLYVEYIFNRDGSFMYMELYFTETVLLCTYDIQLLFNRDGSFMFSFVRGMYFLPRWFFMSIYMYVQYILPRRFFYEYVYNVYFESFIRLKWALCEDS